MWKWPNEILLELTGTQNGTCNYCSRFDGTYAISRSTPEENVWKAPISANPCKASGTTKSSWEVRVTHDIITNQYTLEASLHHIDTPDILEETHTWAKHLSECDLLSLENLVVPHYASNVDRQSPMCLGSQATLILFSTGSKDFKCARCGKLRSIKLFPFNCSCGRVYPTEASVPHKAAVSVTKSADGILGLRDVTACVTAYMRPDCLQRLMDSIQQHYPDLRVEVEDTRGNLSRGRNQLVARCETELCLILEDDFEFAPATKIERLLEILNYDVEVGVAGGSVRQTNTKLAQFPDNQSARDLRLFRNVLEEWVPPAGRWHSISEGVRYQYCDMVTNFFLARREVLEENPWDEELELGEHAPWFLMLRQQANWRTAYTNDVVIDHHRARPTPEYEAQRKREHRFRERRALKYGFDRTVFVDNRSTRDKRPVTEIFKNDSRPNMVILGVGHQGSRVFASIMMALGWNAGIYNERFMENKSFVEANRLILREHGICQCGATAEGESVLTCPQCSNTFERYPPNREDIVKQCVASLTPPWVLKDPRFVITMSDQRWREALDDLRPTLLLIERNYEAVKRSYERRKNRKLFVWGHSLESLLTRAREEYERWPWNKVRVTFEQLLEAAKCVDLDRAAR
jgi:hypothetical protein